MKRILIPTFAAMVAALMLLTACSAGKRAESGDYPNQWNADHLSQLEYGLEGLKDGANYAMNALAQAEPGENSTLIGQKVIKDAELSVQTLDFDEFSSALNARILAIGGYIERNDVRGRSIYNEEALRYATMVLRVPAEKLDEFLGAVAGICNVLSRSESAVDITSQYVDTEAQLNSLRVEYDTLLGLLQNAESLDNIITLQDRLSNVRYRIESMESTLRSYDSLVAYSTVTLEISEVERETVVEKEGFGKEVGRRFNESLEDVGQGFRSFAVWFIGDLPHIVITLAIIGGIVFIVLFIIKMIKRGRAKRRARANAAYSVPAPSVQNKGDK